MRRARTESTANLQAIAFAAAAGGGALAIVALKLLGVRQLLVTVAPVTVMLLYALLVIRPYFRARADQIGDNCYYLGFIFTLISLSLSLAQFSAGGSAQEIVSNFGIALATTLVGVALRVMFNQMRSDPLETEREARLELAEASRRLKAELTNAAVEFSMAARASRQSVTDAVEEMREHLGASLRTAGEGMSSTVTQAGERLARSVDEAGTGLAGSAAQLGSELGRAGRDIAVTSEAIRASMDESATGWGEKVADLAGRNSEFNATARKLVGAVERLSARVDGIAPDAAVAERLAALAAAAAALEAALGGARGEIATAGAGARDLLASAAATHERAQATADTAARQAAVVGEAGATIGRAAEAVTLAEGAPERLEAALAALDHRLAGSTSRFADEVSRALAPALAKAEADDATLARLTGRLEELVDEIRADRAGRQAETFAA